MEQISNNGVNNVNFRAQEPVTQPQQAASAPVSNPIQDGDKKSMDALKWAGLIAAGTLAAGLATCAIIRGKGIDASKLDTDVLKNSKVYKLKNPSEMNSVTKLIKGVSKDGTIKNGKIIGDSDLRKLSTKVIDGKRVSQEVTKDGQSIILRYNSDGKLAETIKDGVTTKFEYNKVGDKMKLLKKTVGDDVYQYSWNETSKKLEKIVKNDNEVTSFTYGKGKLADKLEEISYPDGKKQTFEYNLFTIGEGDNAKQKYLLSNRKIDSAENILEHNIFRNEKTGEINGAFLQKRNTDGTKTKTLYRIDDKGNTFRIINEGNKETVSYTFLDDKKSVSGVIKSVTEYTEGENEVTKFVFGDKVFDSNEKIDEFLKTEEGKKYAVPFDKFKERLVEEFTF